MRFSRGRAVRGAVMAAGAAAVAAGLALGSQQIGSTPSGHAAPGAITAQDAAVSNAACTKIHRQLAGKKDVDIDTALRCDQQEFAALEQQRLAGKTDNRVQLSETCQLVNGRLASGDATVQEEMAEACRNRELFAIDTDTSNERGGGDRLTAMCVGKNKLDKTDDAPDFEDDACTDKPFGQRPLPVSEDLASAEPSASPSPDVSPSPQDSTPGFDRDAQCGPIRTAIQGKQDFDEDLAVKCAQADTFPLNGRPTRLGDTCVFVELRAQAGDLDMPVPLLLACDKIEATVFKDRKIGDGTTSICRVVRQQESADPNNKLPAGLLQECAKQPLEPSP